jgi:hypothetical protein
VGPDTDDIDIGPGYFAHHRTDFGRSDIKTHDKVLLSLHSGSPYDPEGLTIADSMFVSK